MEKFIKKRLIFILLDLILVFSSFVFIIFVKAGSLENYLPKYFGSLLVFIGLWFLLSWFFKKYSFRDYDHFGRVLRPILISNFVILGTASLLMYFSRTSFYSRTIVFGTLIIASGLELLFGMTYHFLRVAKEHEMPSDHEYAALRAHQLNGNGYLNGKNNSDTIKNITDRLKKLIIGECGEKAFAFVQKNHIFDKGELLVVSTSSLINVQSQLRADHKMIVNLKRINDTRHLSRFFSTINEGLPKFGRFMCCVETKDLRKKRIFEKYPFIINYLYYYFLDFPMKRVFPKFTITRGIYFFLTRGMNRVITRAETLGRLIAAGFDIIDEEYIGNLCYISAKKIKAPKKELNTAYGPLIGLNRIGQNGKIIKVYKMRTMYPFSEYLQEYIYQRYNLKDGGKFDHDFRVSTQGKFMRRFWLDEVPMLINLFQGDLRLVGVRPLSTQYFSLYSKILQRERIKYKPGLIPPYYYDMPKTLKEIQQSELNYLKAWNKHPFRTDWNYFWKALFNIIFKKERSQ